MTHVGEIIASSTTRFSAQCPDEDSAPAFGSFVVVDAAPEQVIGVVAEVRAGTLDANRRPMAFGLSQEELFRQQPQLRELLATEFDAVHVGYGDDVGVWRQILPPRPPRLHRFVQPAAPAEIAAVTADGDWLRTLAAAEVADDLLAAAVRASLAAHGDARDYLVRMGRVLARLVGDDYERLQALLRRLRA
jgi:hypothetical protein